MAHALQLAPTQALKTIQGYARAGRVAIAGHAAKRMRQRNVRYSDVRSCLTHAQPCAAEPKARWKVVGPDCGGDDLACVVVIRSGLLVVTVF